MYSFRKDELFREKSGIVKGLIMAWDDLGTPDCGDSIVSQLTLKRLCAYGKYSRDLKSKFNDTLKRMHWIPEIEVFQYEPVDKDMVSEKCLALARTSRAEKLHLERVMPYYPGLMIWVDKLQQILEALAIHVSTDWIDYLWFPRDHRDIESAIVPLVNPVGECNYCMETTTGFYNCSQCRGFWACPKCMSEDFWKRSNQFEKTSISCIHCRMDMNLALYR